MTVMAETTNNITVTKEITFYKCEISRDTGDEILIYEISQPKDDTLVDDDEFYREYDELRQRILTNRLRYKHSNTVNSEIKQKIYAHLQQYIENPIYKCVCIIFPYDGLTTYNEYYCNQITQLVKSYMDSLQN